MKVKKLTVPPKGWNSFDCHGIFINEEQALMNLDKFIEILKPHGYEYFCIDAGWYTEYAKKKYTGRLNGKNIVDKYSRMIASPRLFPRGLKYIADKCHENSLKFGIHIMRGIPRDAVNNNSAVKGSAYHAEDIADTTDICTWNPFFYGVDMHKPGAQEYYDSIVEYLVENDVDFIKADDITDFPDEIEAVAKAIEKVSRPMVLSLSPGRTVSRTNMEIYRKNANMVRITTDVWDTRECLQEAFDRWELWENDSSEECYIDLDMIPFGMLQVYAKKNNKNNNLLSGLGTRRRCRFNLAQQRTFITQRALAASPLIFGGELTMTLPEDFALVTNKHMLECNSNCITGKKIFAKEYCDIRKAPNKNLKGGWIGIFNRWSLARTFTLSLKDLGFGVNNAPESFYDIWNDRVLSFDDNSAMVITLEADDVLFLKYC